MALDTGGTLEEIDIGKAEVEQPVGGGKSDHQRRGGGPHPPRDRDVGLGVDGDIRQLPLVVVGQHPHRGERQVLPAIEQRGLGAGVDDLSGGSLRINDHFVPDIEREREGVEARSEIG